MRKEVTWEVKEGRDKVRRRTGGELERGESKKGVRNGSNVGGESKKLGRADAEDVGSREKAGSDEEFEREERIWKQGKVKNKGDMEQMCLPKGV